MEAYSLDLRQRVCAACDEKCYTIAEVAERFGVGRWFVHKLLRQRRQEGSIAAKQRGHGPAATIGVADQRRLRKLVRESADATLAELCQRLHEAGGPQVGVWTMCRALKKLRLPLKKRHCMPASVTRRACGRCVVSSGNRWRGWTRPSWFSWMKVASTPR